jgi:hypothetical protein
MTAQGHEIDSIGPPCKEPRQSGVCTEVRDRVPMEIAGYPERLEARAYSSAHTHSASAGLPLSKFFVCPYIHTWLHKRHTSLRVNGDGALSLRLGRRGGNTSDSTETPEAIKQDSRWACQG